MNSHDAHHARRRARELRASRRRSLERGGLATAVALGCGVYTMAASGQSTRTPTSNTRRSQTTPRAATAPRPDDDIVQGLTVRSRYEPGAATTTSFRREELVSAPGTGTDPTRLVSSMPGVGRSPYGIGFFSVRGTSFENTVFVLDGFPILNLYHFAGGPSVLPSTLIGGVDFHTGNYPVQYGRATGGMIVVDTRAPENDRPRGTGELSVFGVGLGVSVPFDSRRGNVTLGIRRSYYELALPIVAPGVQLNLGDAHVRAEWAPSDRVRFTALVMGSSDIYDRRAQRNVGGMTSANRDGIVYQFLRAIGRVEYRAGNGASAQLAGMLGVDEVQFVSADTGRPDTAVHYGGATAGVRGSLRLQSGRALTATFGVDALAYAYDASVSYPGAAGFAIVPPPQSNRFSTAGAASITQLSVAPYAEATVRAGPVELTGGLRMDNMAYGGHRFVRADPRFVARVHAGRDVQIIAATGLFHQAPPFFALVPIVGNPALVPQRSWQSSVGVEVNLPWSLSARVTGYFSLLSNLPRPTQDLFLEDGQIRRVGLASDGEGRAMGLEFQLRRRLANRVFGWLSYTLGNSVRWVGTGTSVPFALDQTHVVSFAASWQINDRWQVGARFNLATGTPTNRVMGATYDGDANVYRADIVPEGDRLPLFHQLDLRVDYRFRAWSARMVAYLDVLNVYFARATEGWNYRYDFNPSQRTPVAGLPILPILGLRGEL